MEVTISLICKRCKEPITAKNEDDLIAEV